MPHRAAGQGIRTVLVSAPAAEPVTLVDLKAHLRVDLVDEEALITAQGTAARLLIEDVTGQRMIDQTWKLVLDRFPAARWIRIPLGPTTAVNSVKSTDRLGFVSTQNAAEYIVDLVSEKARIVLKEDFDWPDPDEDLQEANAVEIEFVVGFGVAASDVDERLKLAVKMLTAHWFENREAVVLSSMSFEELPMAVQSLIGEFRLWEREF